MRASMEWRRLTLFFFSLLPWGTGALPAQAQTASPRERALSLEFGELRFAPPEVKKKQLSRGVDVLFLEDHGLPLVTLYARFEGGYALLPRRLYAAATALPALLRSGGTTTLPPDSVDHLLEFYALQTAFGGGGEGTFSSLNTLSKHLRPALNLWTEILRRPRFDSVEVEVWRGRQSESIRRQKDSPGGLAFSAFNRIMFGDHPIGWEMEAADLTPERFSRATVEEARSRIICPENLILGVVGDVTWKEIEPLLETLVNGWDPCTGRLQEPMRPDMRRGRGVFLIPRELTQSTVVMAEPGGVIQEASEDYFASRIGNSILGGGGFSSRLGQRVRTDRGWAYSASSVWTTPARYEGVVGAVTQTKSETTVAAVQLILETIEEMRDSPPSSEEVDRAVSQIVNGFVFNFQDPAQILSRQMFYLSQDLPEDWLEQYLRGVQEVSPRAVQRVFQRHVHPDRMTILILGDPESFDFPPDRLGPVQIWEIGSGTRPDTARGPRQESGGRPREGPDPDRGLAPIPGGAPYLSP
jgi:predicted Zn-dependent peptidase